MFGPHKLTTRYGSKTAEKLHTATCGYIAGQKDIYDVRNCFEEALASHDKEALGYVSANGHTHLLDAIHLSHTDMCPSPALRSQKANKLLNLYCELATQTVLTKNQITFKILLLNSASSGHAPIHQLMINNDVACARLYFQLIEKAIRHNCVNLVELRVLLQGKICKSGDTFLHVAAQTANKEMLTAIAAFMAATFRDAAKETLHDLLHQHTNKKNRTVADTYPDVANYILEATTAALAQSKKEKAKASKQTTVHTAKKSPQVATLHKPNMFSAIAEIDEKTAKQPAPIEPDKVVAVVAKSLTPIRSKPTQKKKKIQPAKAATTPVDATEKLEKEEASYFGMLSHYAFGLFDQTRTLAAPITNSVQRIMSYFYDPKK